MAFPDTIVTFPTKKNISASDGELISKYQKAIESQDEELALNYLRQIPYYGEKIISASYLNSIGQTVKALEIYYLEKYSPAIVVSASQPVHQDKTDMWFQITGTNT